MKAEKAVTPNRILEMGWDFARSRALATAVELDIFTHIANGKDAASDIALATGSTLRGIEMLLNALVGLELLEKDEGGHLRLAPDSREFLVRGKPGYLGDMSMHAAQLNGIWSHLTESVKKGKPYLQVNGLEKGEEFFPSLVKALFNMNYQAARYAASYLRKEGRTVSKILDVGAGSGVWGIGIAQEFQGAKVVAVDFPAVCGIAREYAGNFKISDRFGCIEGDLRDVDFGKGGYDLVILGHVCHSEGRKNTENLIKKSFAALEKGGGLLIADFIPNDDRTRPAIPLLFALNMLLNTDEGDVFTIKEYRRWLSESGFHKVDILDQAPSHSPLILATK